MGPDEGTPKTKRKSQTLLSEVQLATKPYCSPTKQISTNICELNLIGYKVSLLASALSILCILAYEYRLSPRLALAFYSESDVSKVFECYISSLNYNIPCVFNRGLRDSSKSNHIKSLSKDSYAYTDIETNRKNNKIVGSI